MSWGMDELVDALDVVDITYSLSRREVENPGHGSVGEEAYINLKICLTQIRASVRSITRSGISRLNVNLQG